MFVVCSWCFFFNGTPTTDIYTYIHTPVPTLRSSDLAAAGDDVDAAGLRRQERGEIGQHAVALVMAQHIVDLLEMGEIDDRDAAPAPGERKRVELRQEAAPVGDAGQRIQIGRASSRERVCRYV